MSESTSNVIPDLDADHRPVMKLLSQCPVYQATPLQEFAAASLQCGEGSVWAKNEGMRMGLGSFKALGGSYAILRLLMDKAGLTADDRFALDNPALRKAAGGETFACATAGNHGLSVAAAARLFGAKAVVYIAESVPDSFAARLKDMGATVVREGAVYEDAMAATMQAAEKNGWQLVADTSWPGYTRVPGLIYQGYTALAEECRQQFSELDRWPSHVWLQAGVGGMAAAVAAHVRRWWPVQPNIVVVEPTAAPCLAKSVAAGQLETVAGPVSSMGRLDCKTPSMLTLASLSVTANRFVQISDTEAEHAAALMTEAGMPTTPSGAAGIAALQSLIGEFDAAEHLVIISESA